MCYGVQCIVQDTPHTTLRCTRLYCTQQTLFTTQHCYCSVLYCSVIVLCYTTLHYTILLSTVKSTEHNPCNIVSHHIAPYYIISNHITSLRIIWHTILFHQITPYPTTSLYILLTPHDTTPHDWPAVKSATALWNTQPRSHLGPRFQMKWELQGSEWGRESGREKGGERRKDYLWNAVKIITKTRYCK